MPTLKNARHERFAQEIAKGRTADQAYVIAGFKEHRGNASTLRSNQSISDRIAQILAETAQKTEVTLEGLLAEAADIQRAALAQGQLAAANGALTIRAKLAGLWIDRAENDNTNRNVDPNTLPDARLADIVNAAPPIVRPALDTTERDADDRLN